MMRQTRINICCIPMQMSHIEEEEKYFHDILDIFYENQWLYKFPVTEILVKNLLNEIPAEWLSVLKKCTAEELNELVVDKVTKPDWPESLVSFVERCIRLDKLPRIFKRNTENLPNFLKKGLSYKKQHEIVSLADLINEQCEANGIDTIVDLGCGLGYVCQLLNYRYNYRVLGLESNSSNVENAKTRQKIFYPSSMVNVRYLCAKIDVDSAKDIEEYLLETFDAEINKFCLIGLHACSDLGVDACKLFDKIDSAKVLVTISCCYHKLEMSESSVNNGYFRNFPVSRTLSKIFESSDRNYPMIFQRPFLRLACQESSERWHGMTEETHSRHSFYVLARAVLELFVKKHSITLTKKVKKATRKTQCQNFETYLNDVLLRYNFHRNGTKFEASMIRDEITSMWLENLNKSGEAEIYTGLQLIFQSPAESLVLRDRRCWLMEMFYETEIIPVTSRIISPRSHAIVSTKKTNKTGC